METKGMMDRTKEVRNRNAADMQEFGAEESASLDDVRRQVASALLAAGYRGESAEQAAEQVGSALRRVQRDMEALHYSTDGLASALDMVDHRLRTRNSETVF